MNRTEWKLAWGLTSLGPANTWSEFSLYVCPQCGSVVHDTDAHDRWHDAYSLSEESA